MDIIHSHALTLGVGGACRPIIDTVGFGTIGHGDCIRALLSLVALILFVVEAGTAK